MNIKESQTPLLEGPWAFQGFLGTFFFGPATISREVMSFRAHEKKCARICDIGSKSLEVDWEMMYKKLQKLNDILAK